MGGKMGRKELWLGRGRGGGGGGITVNVTANSIGTIMGNPAPPRVPSDTSCTCTESINLIANIILLTQVLHRKTKRNIYRSPQNKEKKDEENYKIRS